MTPLYLFDTNTVSAIMADHAKVKSKVAMQPGRLVTCAIVRGEIQYGLERLPAGKRRTNLEAKASAVFAVLPIEPITSDAGETYGATRRSLELKGHNLSDNDLWIAASVDRRDPGQQRSSVQPRSRACRRGLDRVAVRGRPTLIEAGTATKSRSGGRAY